MEAERTMRRSLVAGNWKMNGRSASTEALAVRIRDRVPAEGAAEVVLCPSFVHLSAVARHLQGGPVALGAQDLCNRRDGAFTGDVSAEMLADVGCRFVIVGHSERRERYSESDDMVASKYRRACDAGLIPILCLGESLAEREAGRSTDVVGRQLSAVIEAGAADALAAGVIAYEPVWAIGTGRTATPEEAQEVHAFIRSRLAARSRAVAREVRILYGGSVKAANAQRLFSMPDVDGGLIGGASLDADEFIKICAVAS